MTSATRIHSTLALVALVNVGANPSSIAAQAAAPPATEKAGPVFANGMAQVVPAFQDTSRWIRQNLWVETDVDSDRDGQEGSRARGRDASGANRFRGLKVTHRIRVESLLRGHGCADFVGWDVQPGAGRRAAGAPPDGEAVVSGEPEHASRTADKPVGAARLRRRALRGDGNGTLAGLPDRRRFARAHADEVRDRLAERTREGIHHTDRTARRSGRPRGRPARSG